MCRLDYDETVSSPEVGERAVATTKLTPEFTSLIAHTHSISCQESDAFLSMLNLGSVQLQTPSQNSRISASP
jgi:hypothetical protein